RATGPRPPAGYALSLRDALPIWPLVQGRPARQLQLSREGERQGQAGGLGRPLRGPAARPRDAARGGADGFVQERPRQLRRHELRSEEHTSELQSRENLVCRLLLE